MKYYIFLLLLNISVLGFGQKSKIDFKSIEKNLKNPESLYNYDKLIFKYKGIPKSLDSIEAQYLYYGRNFESNKLNTSDNDFKSLAEAFKNNNFDDCIRLGKVLYGKDPTNMDVLLILLRAYDSKKDVSNFTHHLAQLRLLADAIKNSGDGKTEKTAYQVNSVGDEYIFLNILNIGEGYTKSSKTVKEGIIDLWEKENNKIYIKVLYLDF
ncbi:MULTISPECIES: DUF4919 domain-containing protein [Chryseobacterium]|uniref:DUF4919 domain-containing protein n=1 Tax=Chryseobacterium TaxID=59732 RepID=UPI00235A3173|nr:MULTISPECIES: DUF4919 domain-containing protein [unclassified Chryseobacterium]MDC8106120.1 DUF4919 domain-containing protein [Chryseobacterium sp. B21-037]MDQ1804624.1 DUF4919 domain-containing protein [Chryseobacterium sp. CKR4-1]WBV55342.1 DUF4919 domain-containing protein [Chryseobacterium daecheongense]